MAVFPEFVTALMVMFPLLSGPAAAGSIADIEHVVLFMQGNNLLWLDTHLVLMIIRRESSL